MNADTLRRWAPFAGALLLVQSVLATVTAALTEKRFAFDALRAAGLKDDVAVADGSVGLLVQAGLVHTSTTHALVNAVGLALVAVLWWRVNRPEERGPLRALVMLAIAVVTSTVGFAVSFLAHNGYSGGASAAAYGILGAVVGTTFALRADLPVGRRLVAPAMLFVLSLMMLLVVLPNPTMDHAAHFGGWAAGLFSGIASQRRGGRVALLTSALAAIVVAAVA